MTLEDIKAALAAGLQVHWKNEGYEVHKDSLGQYLVTFTDNGSTIGLTNRAGTTLNGKPEDFFVTSIQLGVSIHCAECGGEDVQISVWSKWNSELQVLEPTDTQDNAFCEHCGETKVRSRNIRDYAYTRETTLDDAPTALSETPA